MIREIRQDDLARCVLLIRESFGTVADEFGITQENAPRFTAFAIHEERLRRQLCEEHRPMVGFFDEDRLVGYYSLALLADRHCELNNLCVLPAYRHQRIGVALLEDAFQRAKDLGCAVMDIGIVEENTVLKNWYASNGFVHIGTQKFDFFPFTCGYMRKKLDS